MLKIEWGVVNEAGWDFAMDFPHLGKARGIKGDYFFSGAAGALISGFFSPSGTKSKVTPLMQ
jgi:hypothetical protein